MTPTIQELAEKCTGLAGSKYWAAYSVLRYYIKGRSEVELIDEISSITNPDIAPYLMAAGLTRRAQEALTNKVEELLG